MILPLRNKLPQSKLKLIVWLTIDWKMDLKSQEDCQVHKDQRRNLSRRMLLLLFNLQVEIILSKKASLLSTRIALKIHLLHPKLLIVALMTTFKIPLPPLTSRILWTSIQTRIYQVTQWRKLPLLLLDVSLSIYHLTFFSFTSFDSVDLGKGTSGSCDPNSPSRTPTNGASNASWSGNTRIQASSSSKPKRGKYSYDGAASCQSQIWRIEQRGN